MQGHFWKSHLLLHENCRWELSIIFAWVLWRPPGPTCADPVAEASTGQFTCVWSGGRVLRGGATRSVVYFRCHTAQISERNCDQIIRLLIDSYRITSHVISALFRSEYTFNKHINLWREQWRTGGARVVVVVNNGCLAWSCTQASERERELARARSQRLKQAARSLSGEPVSREFAGRGALEGYPYTSMISAKTDDLTDLPNLPPFQTTHFLSSGLELMCIILEYNSTCLFTYIHATVIQYGRFDWSKHHIDATDNRKRIPPEREVGTSTNSALWRPWDGSVWVLCCAREVTPARWQCMGVPFCAREMTEHAMRSLRYPLGDKIPLKSS